MEFFHLYRSEKLSWWAEPVDRTITTKRLSEYLRAVNPPTQEDPFKVVLTKDMNKQELDIMGVGSLLVLNDRTEGLLKQNGLTGYVDYPVEIYRNRGEPRLAVAHGLGVEGRAGPLDNDRSVKSWGTRANGTRIRIEFNGIYFDHSTWDGSDFFLLADVDFLLVTRRVVDVFKRNAITGWKAAPLERMYL